MSNAMFFLLMSAIYIAPDLSRRVRNLMGFSFIVAAAVTFIGKIIWRVWI